MTDTTSNTQNTPEDEQNGPQEPVEAPEGTDTRPEAPEAAQGEDREADEHPEPEGDTFPREYVERLRREAAGHRDRAKQADELRAALWTARVAATGRLADPTDLVMPDDADPLDAEQVDAAVDELLATKPHLASRRPTGDVGQGATPVSGGSVDLAGLLRSRAG